MSIQETSKRLGPAILLFLVLIIFIIVTKNADSYTRSSLSIYPYPKSRSYTPSDTSKIKFDAHGRQTNNWKIIAFTDKNYLPIAQIWYQQMTDLGYKEHYLVALDYKSLDFLKNNNYRYQKAVEFLPKSATKQSNNNKPNKQVLSSIWKIRLKTIQSILINEKTNLFITDVDSFWVKYKDLNLLPPNIDSFHGTGKTFPKYIFEKWGFVICGCIGAYHYNLKTLNFVNKMVEGCQKMFIKDNDSSCDDQVVMNSLYLDMNINWEIPPGMNARFGYTKSTSSETDLKVMIFSENEVLRGIGNFQIYEKKCAAEIEYQKPWIVSPNSKKTIFGKVEMIESIPSCMSKNAYKLSKQLLQEFS